MESVANNLILIGRVVTVLGWAAIVGTAAYKVVEKTFFDDVKTSSN